MRVILLALVAISAHANSVQNFQKFQLGRLLFFDKILSGNKNISCASCHHPTSGTSDGLSLGVGEGGSGIGLNRNLGKGVHAVHERVPRNSPEIFNRHEMKVIFHDGRLHLNKDYPSGIYSPAEMDLPEGLDSMLSAQALFPITSGTEMAGQKGENPIANAAAEGRLAGVDGVWNLIEKRLRSNRTYIDLFRKSFPTEIKTANDISIKHMGNAIGFFERHAFTSKKNKLYYYKQNPSKYPLSQKEKRGLNLFFGKARCTSCHNGEIFTDSKFYSIALPPIGQGKGDGFKGLDDFGLAKVTKNKQHRYKFRTPSLINVTETGPYGHNGAYGTLKGIIKHHTNPSYYLVNYDPKKAGVVLPYRQDLYSIDFKLLNHPNTIDAISASSDIKTINITDEEIDDIIAFLGTLKDVDFAKNFTRFIPKSVPSGLPVDL